MCLILLAWNCHPEYRLILLANRDEFYQRPSAPLSPWPEREDILAGRDLLAGGTWLGLAANSRFAAITNVRRPGMDAAVHTEGPARSRGDLVASYLRDGTPAPEHLRAALAQGGEYAGFNLLAGDAEHLVYGSNALPEGPRSLPPGLYGLSNATLNTPWPKVEGARVELGQWLRSGSDPEALLDILLDERRPADSQLPDTGIGIERERVLASRFIRTDEYGTRASSLLLIHHNGDASFREWRFAAGGEAAGTDHYVWPAGTAPRRLQAPAATPSGALARTGDNGTPRA